MDGPAAEPCSSIEEGKKLFDDATSKFKDAYTSTPDFDERSKLEAPMKDVAAKFDSAAGKMKEAARGMDDAAKLNLQDWYKEYLSTFAQRARKEAEIRRRVLGMAKSPTTPRWTPTTTGRGVTASNESIEKLATRSARSLQAKMDKITEAHKTDFKK